MAQRISRAKQTHPDARRPVRAAAAGRAAPSGSRAVLHVLYLIFNEGYTASAGPVAAPRRPQPRGDPADPAGCTALLPDDGEAAGLLALMLLTDARRAARTDADGWLVPLAEQDRDLWDADGDRRGRRARSTGRLGTGRDRPLSAAGGDRRSARRGPAAPRTTDWRADPRPLRGARTVAPGPLVTLNRAVAVAMVARPAAALALVGTLDADERLAHTHRLEAVRAHLLEQAGNLTAARDAYERAARATASRPEQLYLAMRAANLRKPPPITMS